MTIDDLGDIGFGDAAVPHGLRVHDHGWAVLALIETARLVRAHPPVQAALPERLLERLLQAIVGLRIAAAPRMAGLTLVAADEDVLLERRHRRYTARSSGRSRRPPHVSGSCQISVQ